MKTLILILVIVLFSFFGPPYYQTIDNYQSGIPDQKNGDTITELESIYKEFASIYLDNGQHQKAIDSYKKILNINSDSLQTWYKLGRTYTNLGDYQEAITCYQRVLEINPKAISVLNDLGWIYNLLGDYQKSIEYFKKYSNHKPDDPEIYFKLGLVNFEAENNTKAKENFSKAKKIAKEQGRTKLLKDIKEVLERIEK